MHTDSKSDVNGQHDNQQEQGQAGEHNQYQTQHQEREKVGSSCAMDQANGAGKIRANVPQWHAQTMQTHCKIRAINHTLSYPGYHLYSRALIPVEAASDLIVRATTRYTDPYSFLLHTRCALGRSQPRGNRFILSLAG